MKPKRVRTDRVTVAIWADANSGSGWEDHGSPYHPHECISAGFLISEDKAQITLAAVWSEQDGLKQSNARITIPKGWIKSRRVVMLVEKGDGAKTETGRRLSSDDPSI